MKKFTLLIFSFLVFQASIACDCPVTTDIATAKANANVIFRGTCLDKNTNWVSSGMKYTFLVHESWVRTIEPFASVNSPQMGSCGYPFEEGKEYLVYVNKKFSLQTTICDPTKPIEDASADLEILGPGMEISASPGAGKLKLVVLIVPILALLFVLFVVLKGKIFKKKEVS